MFRLLLVYNVIILCSHGNSKEIIFNKCKSDGGELVVLDVTPCSSQPCVFHKETTVKCMAAFTPNEEITSSTIELFGKFFGQWILWHTFDGCEKGIMSCPIKSGKTTTFNISIQIPNIPPKILDMSVKIDMKDQMNKTNLCGLFDAIIEN